jgi:GT2 family glycosyltransferase
MDKISLMMVTYNRLELTKITIENIKKRTSELDYNFIIVDNGSTDGTVEYLKELGSGYDLILNIENQGIGIGRNQSLKRADELGTDWYVTIDNDIDVPDGWLSDAINILKANQNYGAIGVNMEGNPYPIVNLNGCIFQNKPQGNLGTACMVFRKQLHEKIGYFKVYNKYGLEDSDFGMRARVAGFKLGYILGMGTHLGCGENDVGEYREWKTYQHDSKVKEFRINCGLYMNKLLPIYVDYK